MIFSKASKEISVTVTFYSDLSFLKNNNNKIWISLIGLSSKFFVNLIDKARIKFFLWFLVFDTKSTWFNNSVKN